MPNTALFNALIDYYMNSNNHLLDICHINNASRLHVKIVASILDT